jgi:site-specific recombinase XerD
MCPPQKATTVTGRYDQALHHARDQRLPPDAPRPCPTSQWPQENVRLLEKYYAWLIGGGAAEYATNIIYLPMAGHILGLNPVPHEQIDLENDLQRALEYVRAKGVGKGWLEACRHGLEKFKRFLRLERGLGEVSKITPFDVSVHTQGLPLWVVTELERYQHIQQKNWRPARFDLNLHSFWSKHGQIWRFLCQERGVQSLADLKRQHILDYVDKVLEAGYSVTSVNVQIRLLHSFLLFLQEEGYTVPQSLLRVPSLKQPDPLPKYLTDEQVKQLRDEIERCVREAQLANHRRQALLDRAAFYLLWQGGMRLGEVEELRLEDLDLPGRRLSVRNGKGLKDRTIYLTESVMLALEEYLSMRGEGSGDHVFLYRNAPLSKDLIRSRFRTIGKRVGVKVYPHRMRHTCATQLLNAGCRVTSIQRFLGHKSLSTTMIYAHAHDQTVAEDYFAAMSRVEQRFVTSASTGAETAPDPEPETEDEVVKVPPVLSSSGERAQILVWVECLALPELCKEERLEIADSLKQALSRGIPIHHQ